METIQAKNQGSCCASSSDQAHYTDPVCGMGLDGTNPKLQTSYAGVDYHFCSNHCLELFAKYKEDIVSGKGVPVGKNRALPAGILGAAGLILLFLTVVILANSTTSFALVEIQRLWYWVLLLAAGFGLQLGLFLHIRHTLRQRMVGATAEVAASGAVSTGSMIACCSHGLVNLLPIFGISAAAALLARYQLPFILFGVFSNLVGVTIMVGLAQKNNIVFSNPLLHGLVRLNMKIIRVFLIITGLVAIAVSIAAS